MDGKPDRAHGISDRFEIYEKVQYYYCAITHISIIFYHSEVLKTQILVNQGVQMLLRW